MAILRQTYLSLFPSLLLPFMLTSCYDEYEPDADTKPVLCINSLITAGSPVEVNVSHTWRYSDPSGMKEHGVKDAKVTLTVNGNHVEEGYVAREGDHIRIDASSPTYGEAWAEVDVPYSADIRDVRFEPKVVSTWWNDEEGERICGDIKLNVYIEIDLRDPSGVNFYQYEYSGFGKSVESEYEWAGEIYPLEYESFQPGELEDLSEPLFREHMDVMESAMEEDAGGFGFFTDRQIEGKTYTLHMNFKGANLYIESSDEHDESWLDCGYDISVNAVSESWYKWKYYDWQTGWMAIGDLADAGLGNPVWGYSNVSTGAGVVAARSVSTFRISLREFLMHFIFGEASPRRK